MHFINKYKLYWLSFLIISIPFLNFIYNNITQIDIILSKSFYFLIILTTIFILITSIVINKFKIDKNLETKLAAVSICFWLFFLHYSLKSFLIDFFNKNTFLEKYGSEITLLIIIAIIFFFIKKIIDKNENFIRFLFISFTIIFFSSIIKIYLNNHEIIKKIDDRNEFIELFSKNNSFKKKNVYFFILDSMQPIDNFEKFYSLDLTTYKNFFEEKEFVYIPNSKSLFDNTKHTLTSFFNLDEKYIENTKFYYPVFLRPNYKPNLILLLDRLGYDFKWVGNMYAYCPGYNLKYCLNNNQNFFIDYYLFINFFKQSPFPQIVTKFSQLFDYDFNKNIIFPLHNGLGRLQNYLNINKDILTKPTFYFVHHSSPHYPYLTNSDCTYNFTPGEKNLEGYKNAYLCDLNRIREMIIFLEKNDPESFIVFQADHNWKMSKNHEKDKKNIFNLIKKNNCEMKKNINYHNINSLKFIFSCMLLNP